MSKTYWPSHPTIPLETHWMRGRSADSSSVFFSHPRDTETTFYIEIGRWDINAARGKWLRQVSSFAIPLKGVAATVDFLIGLALEEMDIDAAANGFLLVGFTSHGDRIRFNPASHIYSIPGLADRRFILQMTDTETDASIPIQVFGMGFIPPRPVESTASARAWHPNMAGYTTPNRSLIPGGHPWLTAFDAQRPSNWDISPWRPRREDIPRFGDHLEWHIGTLWTPFTWGGRHAGRTSRRWCDRAYINHDRYHGKFVTKHGHIPYEWITRYQTSTQRKEEASRWIPGARISTSTIWQSPPSLAAITVESIMSPWVQQWALDNAGVGRIATSAREAHHSEFISEADTRPSGSLPPGWTYEPAEEPMEWW